MLNINCLDYLQEVKEFAKKTPGLLEQLESKLEYLNIYGGDNNYSKCDLFQYFTPYSFTFNMYGKNGKGEFALWFNGGLIYQGPNNPADGSFPSLTVSLAQGTGWFVHT